MITGDTQESEEDEKLCLATLLKPNTFTSPQCVENVVKTGCPADHKVTMQWGTLTRLPA